jgi:hypothetical protein
LNIEFKHKVVATFIELINSKIALLETELDELKEIGANESKSTAGDKHETALAMVQIEQDRIRTQYADALQILLVFKGINQHSVPNSIQLGSLVHTNKGYFYIAAAAGKIIIDTITVIAISPEAPLGKLLIGKQVSDKVVVNNNEFIIASFC